MSLVRVFIFSFFKKEQSLPELFVTLLRLNYTQILEYSDRIGSLFEKILAVEIFTHGPYILAMLVFTEHCLR